MPGEMDLVRGSYVGGSVASNQPLNPNRRKASVGFFKGGFNFIISIKTSPPA